MSDCIYGCDHHGHAELESWDDPADFCADCGAFMMVTVGIDGVDYCKACGDRRELEVAA